jgi:pimeloyl-ACP methyl ester carboxylesterase
MTAAELPGAAHLTNVERPGEFTATVTRFLAAE